MKFGNLIYEVRESRGLTRTEAAEGICSDKYIYLIEKNERTPSVKILYQLSLKLKFNFFHTLSYLSADNPLELKDAINTFIQYRIANDYIGIKKYIQLLETSDNIHKESFKQLVNIHKSILDLKQNCINATTLQRLHEAYMLTSEVDFNSFNEENTYHYLELLSLSVHAICRFKYYGEYNFDLHLRLFEYSKSLFKKDESIDVALLLLRSIIDLLKNFDKKDEIIDYINNFHMCFIDSFDFSSKTSETSLAKELISNNVDLVSRYIEYIYNKDGTNILQIYFIEDNLVIFKTIGICKTTFTDGLQQYYSIIENEFSTQSEYDLIIDLSSFSHKSLSADYFSLNKENTHIFDADKEKKRNNTYIVIPKLNQTILDVLLIANQLMENFSRFEPIVINTILDGIIQNNNRNIGATHKY